MTRILPRSRHTLLALALVFGSAITATAQPSVAAPTTPSAAGTPAQVAAPASPVIMLPDFTELVEKAGPAVVNIRTAERARQSGPQGGDPDENDQFYEFFKRFFPPGQMPQRPGQTPTVSYTHLTLPTKRIV